MYKTTPWLVKNWLYLTYSYLASWGWVHLRLCITQISKGNNEVNHLGLIISWIYKDFRSNLKVGQLLLSGIQKDLLSLDHPWGGICAIVFHGGGSGKGNEELGCVLLQIHHRALSCAHLIFIWIDRLLSSRHHDPHFLVSEELPRLNGNESSNGGCITSVSLLKRDWRRDVLARHKFGDGAACNLHKGNLTKKSFNNEWFINSENQNDAIKNDWKQCSVCSTLPPICWFLLQRYALQVFCLQCWCIVWNWEYLSMVCIIDDMNWESARHPNQVFCFLRFFPLPDNQLITYAK